MDAGRPKARARRALYSGGGAKHILGFPILQDDTLGETKIGNNLTSSDRATAALLRWLPPLAFLFCALPLPLYFLLQRLTATEGAGEYAIFALTALALGSLVGLFVAALIFLYRQRWLARLRDRLAADGVNASELDWFTSELTGDERRTLRRLERENLLLADAYRDTLAARVTAARLAKSARRELAAVERRAQNAARLQPAERAALNTELETDRARLAQLEQDAAARRAQLEARLQQLEAAAGRATSEADTRRALQQLELATAQPALALEAARLEREARAEADAALRERDEKQ